MLPPNQVKMENIRKTENIIHYRHEKQIKFQEIYEKLIKETTERIRKERSAVMEENMRSEIRNWINDYFQQTGKIPDLPSAESGGSRFIFSRQVYRYMYFKCLYIHIYVRLCFCLLFK